MTGRTGFNRTGGVSAGLCGTHHFLSVEYERCVLTSPEDQDQKRVPVTDRPAVRLGGVFLLLSPVVIIDARRLLK